MELSGIGIFRSSELRGSQTPPNSEFLAVQELHLELPQIPPWALLWDLGCGIWEHNPRFSKEKPSPAGQRFLEHKSHAGTGKGFRHLLSVPISFRKLHWCLIKNLIICPLKLAPAGAGRQPGLSRLRFPWLRSLQRSHPHRKSYFWAIMG